MKLKTSSRTEHDRFWWPVQALFRSNIPRRRRSILPEDINKRNFFGWKDLHNNVVNGRTNPSSPHESSRKYANFLQRKVIKVEEMDNHPSSFVFRREKELSSLQNVLSGTPTFTTIFGTDLVGKTTLLRDVLSSDEYLVLEINLREVSFDNLAALCIALNKQIEHFLDALCKRCMLDRSLLSSFQVERQNLTSKVSESPSYQSYDIGEKGLRTLMNMLEDALVRYERFLEEKSRIKTTGPIYRGSFMVPWRSSQASSKIKDSDTTVEKLKLVMVLDDAHRISSLIESERVMMYFYETLVWLSKRRGLCHIVQVTNDPLHYDLLLQCKVVNQCKILTIGDCSEGEIRNYFQQVLVPSLPDHLQRRLEPEFDHLYSTIGGRLAHWQDFASEYAASNGALDVKECSHFLQAHTLLNIRIIRSSQPARLEVQDGQQAIRVHPVPGEAAMLSEVTGDGGTKGDGNKEFTAVQLLKVMTRLTQRQDVAYLPYFMLCREMGVDAVNSMIRARVLDLRWTDPITDERTASEEGGNPYESILEVVGPKLVPVSGIMRVAMRVCVAEYEDSDTETERSEYASLSEY